MRESTDARRVDWVGPYCGHWIEDEPPFCILSGGSNASTCPGAVQWGNESLYWTGVDEICERSQSYIRNYCKCGPDPEYDLIGPYCAKWVKDYPPYCYLSGGYNARHCPGAAKV